MPHAGHERGISAVEEQARRTLRITLLIHASENEMQGAAFTALLGHGTKQEGVARAA